MQMSVTGGTGAARAVSWPVVGLTPSGIHAPSTSGHAPPAGAVMVRTCQTVRTRVVVSGPPRATSRSSGRSVAVRCRSHTSR